MKYLNVLRFLFLSFVIVAILNKIIGNATGANANPTILADEKTSMPKLVIDSSTEQEAILLIGE
jgi:hypothetical protein